MNDENSPDDFDRTVYSKYLNGVSIEDITNWVNWYSPRANLTLKDAAPKDINELIDQMNEIFL